jgi:hypothetical protein
MTTKNVDDKLRVEATKNAIKLGPQIGQKYMFRTLSLYWIGTVLDLDAEWILLEPGTVEVVLSVGGDLNEVHLKGVTDSRRSPVECYLNRTAIIEFSPVRLTL